MMLRRVALSALRQGEEHEARAKQTWTGIRSIAHTLASHADAQAGREGSTAPLTLAWLPGGLTCRRKCRDNVSRALLQFELRFNFEFVKQLLALAGSLPGHFRI